MNSHHFGMPHPDSYLSHLPDLQRSEKSEAVDANSEDMKAHPGVIEAHNGAVEAPLEPWKISTVVQCCGIRITLARSLILIRIRVKIEY
jgi:hypothetical protein